MSTVSYERERKKGGPGGYISCCVLLPSAPNRSRKAQWPPAADLRIRRISFLKKGYTKH